ncbi:unnamed protein product [Urochloa humidicola]
MTGEGSRASWNFNYEKALVDILQMHKHQRFRGQNGWTSEGWKSIVKHFNEKFPLAGFSKAQIQEKEKELKGNYKAVSIGKKKSGLSFNSALGMINAEPEIWKELIDENPRLKKLQSKPFPLFESLEKVYEGSIATGDLNFTSTQQFELPPPSTTEHVSLSGLDATDVSRNPFSESTNAPSGSINVVDDDGDEIEPASSTSSGQKKGGSARKRKQSQVAGVLQDYVDFRKKVTGNFLDQFDDKKKPSEDYSIKRCLNILESIEELSDEEKAKATSIFKCELNREIFINFKNPHVRLLWVKGEITPKA